MNERINHMFLCKLNDKNLTNSYFNDEGYSHKVTSIEYVTFSLVEALSKPTIFQVEPLFVSLMFVK